MRILTTKSGFAIKQPYSLKTLFKTCFPSARWNPDEQQWEVGPRTGERLAQWAELAEPLIDVIRLNEEAEFNENELNGIRLSLLHMTKNMEAKGVLLTKVIESRQALEREKQALEAAKIVVIAQDEALQTEKLNINGLINGIIDRPTIDRAMKIMAANHAPGDRVKKAKFEEARAIVKGQRDRLAAAGWRCVALSEIASANVNRPDRDDIRNISTMGWLKISKIEAE